MSNGVQAAPEVQQREQPNTNQKIDKPTTRFAALRQRVAKRLSSWLSREDPHAGLTYLSQGVHIQEDPIDLPTNWERSEQESVRVYDLGQTSAFLLRARRTFTPQEYDEILTQLYADKSGVIVFPSGEGTEFSGLFTTTSSPPTSEGKPTGLERILALGETYDIDIGVGLALPDGPTFVEYDRDNEPVSKLSLRWLI